MVTDEAIKLGVRALMVRNMFGPYTLALLDRPVWTRLVHTIHVLSF